MIIYTNYLILAKWKDRFFAWIIDFVIVSITIGVSIGIAYSFGYFIDSDWWTATSVISFAYGIFIGYSYGQSLGKRVLHLKTVKTDGTNPSLLDCIINSFGKAFFLPLDIILGLIFTDKKSQRVFNRLSNTIVIMVPEENNKEIS